MSKFSDRAKKAAATRAANKAKKAELVESGAASETKALTYTHGPDAVTIEDLSVVPPIRAHGASVEQAEAAYDAQAELRGRHDAQADTEPPGVQTSDLTPGRVA